MKNLQEEIQRSKKLMGVSEGLNTPNKNVTTAITWFTKLLSQMTAIHDKNNPNNIHFQINKKNYLTFNRMSNELWINDDKITTVFESKFGLKHKQIQMIIQSVMLQNTKLKDLSLSLAMFPQPQGNEKIFNRNFKR